MITQRKQAEFILPKSRFADCVSMADEEDPDMGGEVDAPKRRAPSGVRLRTHASVAENLSLM